MLVISREASVTAEIGSVFYIGDTAVQVIETRGRKVRLGIAAPPEIQIVRDDAKVTLPNSPQPGCTDESPRP